MLLVLSAFVVSAAEFDVSLFPSERTIKANETAVFELEVEHNSPIEEFFEVYATDVTWDIRPETSLRVPSDKKLKTKLFVRPLNLNPGAYNIPITFKRSGSRETQKKLVYIQVESQFPQQGTYLPGVRGTATVTEKIDPREGLQIKLSLENQNLRDLKQVNIKARSDVVNKDYETSLGPQEKKTLTFDVELDPLTPPQKDQLHISIIVPEREKAYQFDLFPIPFEVEPYGVIMPKAEAESSFMKTVEHVTFTSKANRELSHSYRVPAWFGKRWFISSDRPYTVEGGNVVWEVSLEPGEQSELRITYNYRPILWVLLIAGVLFLAYYWFRSPIVVKKQARVVKTHEGGITELKIVVDVTNRGGKPLHKVEVMDLAPHLVDVVREFKGAMLQPSKIMPHNEKGTLVKWDVGTMEPKEQRVLTYNVKTRLGVLGGLTLPVTAVQFTLDGHTRETVSNKTKIYQNE